MLEQAGCNLSIRETTGAGHATELARAAGPYDRVVVAGGDGTVNEVINGLAELEDAPPFGLIPVGTSNVLAAEIGLNRRNGSAANAILKGDAVPIALGRVNGRYFSVMTGAGIDAHLVAQVDLELKKRIGAAAYAASFFRQLRQFDFPGYKLSVDGESHVVGSVIIANARRYAPTWVIAPNADVHTADLQICRIDNPGRFGSVGAAMALFGGRFAEGRWLTIESGQRVTIDGRAGEPVQADGEIVTSLPAEITVAASELRLLRNW